MSSKINIAILGFGGIGRTIAMLLLSSNENYTINIIDPDPKIEGAFMDFQHANHANQNCTVHLNDSSLLNSADFIFHCAGIGIAQKEERDSVFFDNVKVTAEIFKNLQLKANCKVIVITNPVDAITYYTWKFSGLKKENVVGVGTLLDTLRMNHFLHESTGEGYQSMLLGEHGKEVVFITSQLMKNNLKTPVRELNRSSIETALNKTIASAKMIKKHGGASIFGVSACALNLFHNFQNKEETILPVSTVLPTNLEQLFNIKNVAISLPTAISTRGAFPKMEIETSQEEKQLLQKAALKTARTIASFQD